MLDNLCTGSRNHLAHIDGRFEFIEADLNDRAAVEQAVDGVEVVFHQAALASVPLSIERPLETHTACATGTVNLLDAARHAGVRRLVYAGSSSMFGNQPEMPKQESHPAEVLSPYAAAKYAGEMYCQAFAASYQLETVRVRYFNVFGPRQDPDSPYSAVIPLFAAALLAGRQPVIFGDGLQSRDFTYVDNVVEANICAARAAGVSGNVYNIACGETLSVIDLLREICGHLNVPFDPRFEPPRPGDVKHSWADISAARRELGYEIQVDFAEGLKRTLDFYVAQSKSP